MVLRWAGDIPLLENYTLPKDVPALGLFIRIPRINFQETFMNLINIAN